MFRGVFDSFDPLASAEMGTSISFRPDCLEHFLFCDVTANFWIDTAPVHVNAISGWNRMLLKAMGQRERGFFAHRSGFVTWPY